MKHRILRDANGIQAVEVAIGAFLVVVMAAIGVDMTIWTMGFSLLDIAARDAARAAGTQLDVKSAQKAAVSQLAIHRTDGTFIQQPTLTRTTPPYFVYQDFSTQPKPSPNALPYVTVTCQLKMRLPINIPFFKVSISQHTDRTGYLTFMRAYSAPITKRK